MRIKNFILCLMFCCNALFAQVDLNVSHDSASTNDYITLTYTVSGSAKKYIPNFSHLKKDFTIISSSQNNQISIINGHVNRQNEWLIIINAKKNGLLTLPKIKFGNEYSPQKQIKITEAAAEKNNNNSELFMTAEADIKHPFVQQQIIYNVKLFYKRRPSSGEFSAPELDHALISPIGKTQNYRTKKNGHSYNVAELNFAAFADKSGELKIKSPVFNGTMSPSNIRDINQLLRDIHKPVHIAAPSLTLNVKPIPSEFQGKTWLPASNVSIEEEWQQQSNAAMPGEPITRLITLRAEGLMASQLPELSFDAIEGAKVYPEPSKGSDETSAQTVIGEKKYKVVYIPTGTQNLTLPEINIPWWNTTTNKNEEAKLKEKKFNVKLVTPMSTVKTTTTPSLPVSEPIQQDKKEARQEHFSSQAILPWVLVIFLSLVLIVRSIKQRNKPSQVPGKLEPKQTALSNRQLKNNFKKACMDNNSQSASYSLLELAKLKWPEIMINQLADIHMATKDRAFKSLVDTLQQALYSTNKDWDGAPLWQAFLNLKTEEHKKKSKQNLPLFN